MSGLLDRFFGTRTDDGRRDEIERRFAALDALGLGWGENAAGYRERLQHLCRFLRQLDGAGPEPGGDSERIRAAVEKLKQGGADPERKARIARLEDLAAALGELIAGRPGLADLGEDAILAHLRDLRDWRPRPVPRPGEAPAAFEARRDAIAASLATLGALPAAGAGAPEGPLDHLLALAQELTSLAPPAPASPVSPAPASPAPPASPVSPASAARPDPRLREDWERLRDCLDSCLADWEWAYLQVQVRTAQLCLAEAAPGAAGRELLEQARTCLADALARMEREGFRQPRGQGLYGLMARVCLRLSEAIEAVAAGAPAGGNAGDAGHAGHAGALLQEALGFASLGIALDPESAPQRLDRVKALAALGDYEEMKVEAEIARALDPGPETLQVIGASFWRRAAAQQAKEPRREVLREAARFYEEALHNLESAPFDRGAPLSRMEAHGWAHFWLGRFQCERAIADRAMYDEAAAHLQVACRLGFKPVESRVEAAWTYLLARDSRQAEIAFAEAVREIDRRRRTAPEAQVAPAPGEERQIVELEFDARLGWAFLTADRAPARVEDRIEDARKLLPAVFRPGKEDLEAALLEVRGRAYYRQGRFLESVRELNRALDVSERSGAYAYLGLAEIGRARLAAGKEREAALRRAAEAHAQAVETDVRDRYQREIAELGTAIQQAKPAAPAALAAEAQAAAVLQAALAEAAGAGAVTGAPLPAPAPGAALPAPAAKAAGAAGGEAVPAVPPAAAGAPASPPVPAPPQIPVAPPETRIDRS